MWAGLGLAAGVGVVVYASSNSSKAPEPGDKPLPGPKPSGGALPGPESATPPQPRAPRKRLAAGDRLFLLGDSLAVGLTAPLRQLAVASEVQFASRAKEGTTIAAWASADVAENDVVLVSLGTNDMKLADPLLERPKLDALLARLTKSSKRVIWLLPPPMPFPDRGVLAMIDDASKVAKTALMPSLDVDRGPDKIHPTGRGYAAWAGFIWNLIS